MKNINNGCKWEIGYCAVNVEDMDPLHFRWLKDVAVQCERFMLGIPDKEVMEKLFRDGENYNPEMLKEFWSEIKWVDDVIILDFAHLDYQKAYEMLSFDVCFYGSKYGRAFEKDNIFMEEHGVDFVPLLPEKVRMVEGTNAIEMPLSQLFLRKKLILFGTGNYFDFFLKTYGEKYKPEYAVDNNESKWGTIKNGVLIRRPDILKEEDPQKVLVIICSKNYESMLQQIHEFGNFDYRLLLYYNEIASLEEVRLMEDIDKDKLVLDKVHAINFEMLKEFNYVCRKHGIQYFLNYGSCLGAIRHQGFIPWDNDVDVCMTRENYEKLVPWKDEFSDKCRFIPPDDLGNKKYFDCVPRLNYKKAYMLMDEDACKFYENHNNRIDLDMFLIDKTYDTFKGKFQRFEIACLYGLMNAYRHESAFFDYSKSMKVANAILRKIGRCFSLNWLRKRVDKVAKRFDNDSKAPYYFISNCALCKLKLLFPADIFDKAIDVPFESLNVYVPEKYDEFLRLIFGDYMVLPPESARVPHWGRILISADTFVFEEPKPYEEIYNMEGKTKLRGKRRND